MGRAKADFDPKTGTDADRLIPFLNVGDLDATKDSILTFNEFMIALFGAAVALGDTGTVSLDPDDGRIFTTSPSGDMTINAPSAPVGPVSIVVTTANTTSRTLTFGTNFKTTGTLATGAVASKVFTISFVGDGTNLNEVSRTTAM